MVCLLNKQRSFCVIFEIASKYCILDSFVDHDGYSISSERFLSYRMLKVRNGGGKEIPLIQGKEQWLCFAGAAVKRCPMPR